MAYVLGLSKEIHVDKIKRPKTSEKPVESFTKEEQKMIEQAVLLDKRDKMFGIILCLYIPGFASVSCWLLNGLTLTLIRPSF